MAYIGTKPTIGNFQICDAISVVNGQAAYTMQVGSVNVIPQSANHMIVSLNGVIQKPGSSFTVSGSTITFASNLATGDVIDFIQILGDVLDLGTPSDATVTAAKIGANAVTAAKLNNDIISGSTELASEPADTDEFLVSDAGTLKRIDYSLIKGGGKINQVLNHGAAVSSSSSSDVEMISLSITPTATSSKVLIMFGVGAQLNSDEYASFDLYRGSLASGTKIMDGEQTIFSAANNVRFGYHFSHLDSPSTTSAITYTVVGVPLFSGTIMFGGGARQTITLMEVLA